MRILYLCVRKFTPNHTKSRMTDERIDEILSVCEMLDKLNDSEHCGVIKRTTASFTCLTTREVIAKSYLLMYLRHCAPHLVTVASAHKLLDSDHVTLIKNSVHVLHIMYVTRKRYSHIKLPFHVASGQEPDRDVKIDERRKSFGSYEVSSGEVYLSQWEEERKLSESIKTTEYSGVSDSGVETSNTHSSERLTQQVSWPSDQTPFLETAGNCYYNNEKAIAYVINLQSGFVSPDSEPFYRLFRLYDNDDNFTHSDNCKNVVTQSWCIRSPVFQSVKIYEVTSHNDSQKTKEIQIRLNIVEREFDNLSSSSRYIRGNYRFGGFEFSMESNSYLLCARHLTR